MDNTTKTKELLLDLLDTVVQEGFDMAGEMIAGTHCMERFIDTSELDAEQLLQDPAYKALFIKFINEGIGALQQGED